MSFRGRRTGLNTALAFAAVFFGASTRAAAQEPAAPPAAVAETTQREMQAVQDLLALATAEFDGAQQSRSIVVLDDIVARLETLRRDKTLPPRGREILLQAYELRGRAYFNIGLQEKAAESFRAIVQVQPQHTLSRDKISPKIVDYFNSVKKALVGYLTASSKPPGARVTLNGEFLSLTDFFPTEVLAGEYTVDFAREGYRSETRTISVAPRATETLEVELTRTAASVFVITEPAAVEIWVDGQLRLSTAGSLAPDLVAFAREKGLDALRASERTEIGGLTPGQHVLEFRRKCHETQRRTMELPEARDYDTDPVRLEETLASLRIRSDPPDGRIFLDGEPMGMTPRELDGVCAGKHRVEVKHASGRFIQDVVLARNESLTLEAPIRPSLAFLGVVTESAAGERVAADVEEKLVRNLARITSLNFLPAPRETVDGILEAEKLSRKGLLHGSGVDPDAVRKATEKLAASLEVQGFLVAALPEERLQRTAVLHLLAAGNMEADTWDVNFNEAASYLRFIAAVDRKATLYRPWTGLVTVDTLTHDGVPLLRVLPASPAMQAGLQARDVVTAADGKPVKQTADLLTVVDGKKPKEKISLRVSGPTGTRTVEVTLGLTPQEIPLYDPSLLYNKVMMDLRQQVEGYPNTEEAAFARLNLAICAMHFGDFAAAHEHLLKSKEELPVRPGLSQGTALYYLGLALERLGYKEEAAEAYRAAAGFKDATLLDNDGPAVAPLASRRAGS